MTKICRNCYVSGLVQGVFYRQSTRQQAIAQNLNGWVKNLADGRVEVLVCGEEQTVLNFVKHWLPQGPPSSKVSHVEVKAHHFEEFNSFEIIR